MGMYNLRIAICSTKNSTDGAARNEHGRLSSKAYKVEGMFEILKNTTEEKVLKFYQDGKVRFCDR